MRVTKWRPSISLKSQGYLDPNLQHGRRTLWLCVLSILWLGWACPLRALTLPIHEIEISSEQGPPTPTALPHFIHQAQSGLLAVNWQIRLPAELTQEELPALLLPQPIQGARFSLNGQLVFELPRSTVVQLYNWYSPILIQLPRHLLQPGQDHILLIEQQGHLRGWFVAPMLVGDLLTLRPLYETYTFISQTLSTTINLLCGLMGIFLVIMGIRTRQSNYRYSGLTILTWSLLFSLALISRIPAEHWFLWRMVVYLLTGWLIYFVTRFIFSIFDHSIPKTLRIGALLLVNAGWIVFALLGQSTEVLLDIVWTGLVVCLYIVGSGWVIMTALHRKDWQRIIPIGMHWIVTSCLAIHDYTLQSGSLPIVIPTQPKELWQNLILQPIYLTHLALPAFAVMALWLLAKDLVQKTGAQLLYEKQLYEQREHIVSDIHDGVGSRINLLLWSLRMQTPDIDHIEDELQRCTEELRFAINPRESGHETLHHALQQLIHRMQKACAASNIALQYECTGPTIAPVPSDIGLHLYKASQECLSNALRYSQASLIVLRLTCNPDEVQIVINDNGCGIAYWDNAMQQQTKRLGTSMGLRSLQNRIQSRGGRCIIHSSALGTKILLAVPLQINSSNR